MLPVIIRCIFQKGQKLYSHIYLDECFYESVWMLEYDRTDISEGNNIKKNKRIERVQNLLLLVL